MLALRRRALTAATLALALVVTSAEKLSAQNNPRIYCFNETSCYGAAFEFADYLSGPQPYTVFTAYFQVEDHCQEVYQSKPITVLQ